MTLRISADFTGEAGTHRVFLGRKAGTDRGPATLVAAEGIPEGFRPGESGRVASEVRERERQRRALTFRGISCIFSRCRSGRGRCGRLCRRFVEPSEARPVLLRD